MSENFFDVQIRLPKDVSDEVDEDPTGNKTIWDRGLLSGAAQKVGLGKLILNLIMLVSRQSLCAPIILERLFTRCTRPHLFPEVQICWFILLFLALLA